ncbi:MAG TPA: type I restriction-modification enzyme R subunit C-terminal domain-containing protein, partial [Prolixibacteraceae bacterium]|nr:type I restriction-modification enzyme R subunit C-terminal domain-containing protein [Prolixibacteraceae bacterium]
KNAFTTYLPQLSSIDLTREKEDNGTRLVFSTYQTIMNKIDSLKNEESRFYSPGHFDLVIIDEAHRSVYQKYGAIFRYFDSLLIGLTATPKTDIDRNTYNLFNIDDNNPTFAYELNQAVTDGYLVPPKAIKVPLRFPREGIRYHDLSDDEKEEYEEKFGDPTTGEADDTISNNALNSWLFNTNTVDRVLAFMMDNGIKTHAGDKLGKTIIFARNHKHALFIEKRFNKMYPEYGGNLLRVIDNFEPKAQELLTNFCYIPSEDNPQIAVSVDMMDTGVDAPRVVNLVFFKPVKSATKYWQMIGRGTRLFTNLFGPGKNKKHFLIFDFCENFEFFGQNPEGIETSNQKSISRRIFEAKLDIALRLLSNNETTPEDLEVAKKYIDELHKQIAILDDNRFEVRLEMRLVNEYSKRQRWENISRTDFNDICNQLSKLPVPATGDEDAKRFDIMILNLQLYKILDDQKQLTIINEVFGIGKRLLKKKNIPAVNAKIETINNVQDEIFWQKATYKKIEQVRCDLRDLIKFLDKEQKYDVFTNFEDYLNLDTVEEIDIIPSYTSMQSYRERVERYIKQHKDHLVIHKIRKNQQITPDELKQIENILFKSEIGTKEEYQKEYGDMPLVKFIRSIVGLDTDAVQQLFAEFIQAGNLTANQITFINTIISYLTKNGTINKEILFEPPFTNLNDQGITGIFTDEAQVTKIISIIDQVNDNAAG